MAREDARELSIFDIFAAIRKKLSLIVSLTLICSVTSFIMSYFILIPIYAATTSIIVQPDRSAKENQYSDIMANQQIVKTYSDIIKSRSTAKKVIQTIGLNTTPEKLQQSITVKSSVDSLVTTIIVEDTNPNNAVLIANKVAEAFIDNVSNTLKVNNIAVLDPAEIEGSQNPVRPKTIQNTGLAAIFGLVLGLGIAFILDVLDKTIKSEEEIADLLNLPVLGIIPHFQIERTDKEKTKHKGVLIRA